VVDIALSGSEATATKVVGDNCVKAGQITWRGAVHGASFPVEIQVGLPGAPKHFTGGQVHVTGPDSLAVEGPGWTLSYRRTAHRLAAH
jgi:hypothetical protein